MTLAYLYLRFSTPRQERGSSRERQEAALRSFAKQKGWTVVEPIIADLGRSAWKGVHLRKGELGKFAKRIMEGDVEPGVIVVEALDRLSRQKPRVTQRWMEDVCDRGFKIASVMGNKVYDADSLNDNIMDILDVLYQGKAANDYVERLSVLSKGSYDKRLEEARQHGTKVGSVPPAWLKAVGKRPNIVWEPIPERVKIVREIFDLACAGQAPWAIAKIFNERGELSFTGKAWERTSIIKILRNRAVEGDYVVGEGKQQKPTGEVLIGYYNTDEPTVALDVIIEARAMMDRRAIRKGKGRNSGAVNNLFGQKLRCQHCGGRMMTTGYQSRYVTCYEAQRSNGCTQRKSFQYRPLEAAVLDEVLHLALDETFFREAEKSNHIGLEIAGAEKAIRDKQGEAERLVKLLSRIDSPTTEANLAGLETEIAAMKAKLAALKKARQAADGNATAKAHLERVHGVREALGHPQDDIRLPARLRVSEALQGIVDHVACRFEDGAKTFYVGILNGAHSMWFDHAGNKIGGWTPDQGAKPEHLITSHDKPEHRAKVQTYFRRANRHGK